MRPRNPSGGGMNELRPGFGRSSACSFARARPRLRPATAPRIGRFASPKKGDTTTVLLGALASYLRETAVGYVEAGLRSGRLLLPVHPNPRVAEPARRILGGVDGVHLVEPLSYLDLVRVLRRSAVVLTDSGGLQEEAPTFGVPVLVLREVTERPEGVEAGTARLVGTRPEAIRAGVREPWREGWSPGAPDTRTATGPRASGSPAGWPTSWGAGPSRGSGRGRERPPPRPLLPPPRWAGWRPTSTSWPPGSPALLAASTSVVGSRRPPPPTTVSSRLPPETPPNPLSAQARGPLDFLSVDGPSGHPSGHTVRRETSGEGWRRGGLPGRSRVPAPRSSMRAVTLGCRRRLGRW